MNGLKCLLDDDKFEGLFFNPKNFQSPGLNCKITKYRVAELLLSIYSDGQKFEITSTFSVFI